ncbi:hypothetical protein L5876_13445 [Hyphobacterium sp. SN044]|uniref:TolB family protein n=1 Tax=Hyphobacterium sp. SN044 TaxID=2912575 RepID=UPI001F2DA7B7|nr:hypothetical protein [Hyphobacterium sp. SN044]MCF8880827.1 hypothetical protein [Hyphobacterium sp. SN044]
MTRTLTLMISAASAALLMACSPENQVPVDEELTSAASEVADEVATQLPDVTPAEGEGADEAAEPDDAAEAMLPTTDIFLADLAWTGAVPAVTNMRNATNHPGYDNQPAFLPNGHDFFYSSESDGGLTDIRIHIATSGNSQQITSTPDSGEYSPRNYGATSGLYFVRQLADGSTQHLVHANANGSDPQPVLDLTTIGYYAFNADRSQVALFVLGETFTLQVADVASGETQIVADGIGRALNAEPGGAAALFTTGNEEEGWALNRYDFDSGETEMLFTLPGMSQDFAAHRRADGTLVYLSSDEGTLYSRTAGTEWAPVADFRGAMITNVTRMAVSDDGTRLAVVADDRSF